MHTDFLINKIQQNLQNLRERIVDTDSKKNQFNPFNLWQKQIKIQ